MSFPHLRTVPPPPPPSSNVHPSLQPFTLPPVEYIGPPNFRRGRAPNRGGGSGWCHRKLPYNANIGRNNQHQPKRIRGNTDKEKPMCNTCDRTFPNSQELAEHIAQHQICGQEGCTFSAHPKVVAIHIDLQHKTGLYARMKKESDDWIEARKRKYPSKGNIVKKMEEQAEKIERGERIPVEKPRFGSRGHKNEWPRHARNHPYEHPAHEQPVTTEPKPKLYESILNNADQVEKESDLPPKEAQTVINNPLASLVGQYNSDSEDGDSPPVEAPVSRELSGPPLPQPPPQERKSNSVTNKFNPKFKRPKVDPREQFKRRNRPPTLLRKLLEPEIRRERNMLLQCIHYVVKNAFFNKK